MHETRRPLLAGNWKQNLGWAAIERYVAELRSLLPDYFSTEAEAGEEDEQPIELLLCAPYPYIGLLGGLLEHAQIYLGAQDVSRFPDGAHTGGVGASMLADLGCDYCIVGHSERRWELGEDSQALAAKLEQLAAEEIVPILCIGERLAERDAGQAESFTLEQLSALKPQLEATPELVLAYEPVWAIGTGRNAEATDAQAMASAIRRWLALEVGVDKAAASRILYGGSVSPQTVASYLAQPDIDGALVGGASLEAASLAALHSACAALL